MPLTPDEAAQLLRNLEQRALEQTAMLQRIAGYMHFIEWAVGIIAGFVVMGVVELAH